MESRFARQLVENSAALRFAPAIERDYRAERLKPRPWTSDLMLGAVAVACVAAALAASLQGTLSLNRSPALLAVPLLACLWIARRCSPDRIQAPIALAAAVCFGLCLEAHILLAAQPALLPLIFIALFFAFGLEFRYGLAAALFAVIAGVFSSAAAGYGLLQLAAEAGFNVATVAATGFIAYRLEQLSRHDFLQAKEIEHLRSCDSLTGLAGKPAFDRRTQRLRRFCEREGIPMALAVIDIDHLDRFNQRYGYSAGNACICKLAATVEASARRPLDAACRQNGGTFMLLLPGCTSEHAHRIVESLRREVIAWVIENSASPTSRLLTVSAGIAASYPRNDELAAADLRQRAFSALGEAKDAGRNRVMSFTESQPSLPANVIPINSLQRHAH